MRAFFFTLHLPTNSFFRKANIVIKVIGMINKTKFRSNASIKELKCSKRTTISNIFMQSARILYLGLLEWWMDDERKFFPHCLFNQSIGHKRRLFSMYSAQH